MNTAASKPRFDLPTIEEESQPFWDGTKDGRLLIGSCKDCQHKFYYPRPFCPECWSENVEMVEASGRGRLYTWSVVFMNDLPPFNERLPYIAAMVDLEEGPRITTNMVDCEADQLVPDMPVKVVFRETAPGVHLAQFIPA